uniref:Conserved hypothetical ABC transporter n=1 Tax=Neisseria meningitidis alpha275 TaxID=295996 RepID=C6SIU7_NEIME|nr:conserved hypothetical ABC transporter [Neisseria meningitidis alpha275]
MSLIECKNINRYFGSGENRVHILKDISLSIEKGDFVAIIGQSGSGKSTLMNILGCLDTAGSGSYRIDGIETAKMQPDELAALRRERFGFIFQRYNLLSSLTARDNVALPAVYMGAGGKERSARADKLLQDLGLASKEGNKPGELSGGQQQRVSIARALMNGGEIIFADEPTGALDTASGKNVMEIIHKLHEAGHTVIMVTHDPRHRRQCQPRHRNPGRRNHFRHLEKSRNPRKQCREDSGKSLVVVLLRPVCRSLQNVGASSIGAQNAFASDDARHHHRYRFGCLRRRIGQWFAEKNP